RDVIGQHPVPFVLRHLLGSEGAATGGALPHPVGRQVHDDPKEPRVERRLPAKQRERLVGPNECFLRDIPRLFPVADHMIREPPHALPVLLDERLEGGQVAGPTALDEGLIVLVHGEVTSCPAASPNMTPRCPAPFTGRAARQCPGGSSWRRSRRSVREPRARSPSVGGTLPARARSTG